MREQKIEIVIKNVKTDENLYYMHSIIDLEEGVESSDIAVEASFVEEDDSDEEVIKDSDQEESNE